MMNHIYTHEPKRRKGGTTTIIILLIIVIALLALLLFRPRGVVDVPVMDETIPEETIPVVTPDPTPNPTPISTPTPDPVQDGPEIVIGPDGAEMIVGPDGELYYLNRSDSGHVSAGAAPTTVEQYFNRIDRSCQVKMDCMIKNVGNMCGASNLCVNKDSIADPALLQQLGAQEGVSSSCVVHMPVGCSCENNVCVNYDEDGNVLNI